MTGLDVYRELMDLDLILQDASEMIPLHTLLSSVHDDQPSLLLLCAEIRVFTNRIRRLVEAGKLLEHSRKGG